MKTSVADPLNIRTKQPEFRLVESADLAAMPACARLRHDYYVLRRRWVRPVAHAGGQETDRYDPYCRHLAVFRGEHPVAYLRALLWSPVPGYMLEHDFRELLSMDALAGIERDHSLEVSRLVLAPDLAPDDALQATELLFRSLYRHSRGCGAERLYAVVEAGWLWTFRRRFSLAFEALGPVVRFPDGTKTVAAHASLADMELALASGNPDKLAWYREG